MQCSIQNWLLYRTVQKVAAITQAVLNETRLKAGRAVLLGCPCFSSAYFYTQSHQWCALCVTCINMHIDISHVFSAPMTSSDAETDSKPVVIIIYYYASTPANSDFDPVPVIMHFIYSTSRYNAQKNTAMTINRQWSRAVLSLHVSSIEKKITAYWHRCIKALTSSVI